VIGLVAWLLFSTYWIQRQLATAIRKQAIRESYAAKAKDKLDVYNKRMQAGLAKILDHGDKDADPNFDKFVDLLAVLAPMSLLTAGLCRSQDLRGSGDDEAEAEAEAA
jgi:hypothetical protein